VERPHARPHEADLRLPAPTTTLRSREVISGRNRAAIVPGRSATPADGTVQTAATQPVGSSTRATRIRPPAGRHVAGNVLYRLVTLCP
jgi:hypothetical protein